MNSRTAALGLTLGLASAMVACSPEVSSNPNATPQTTNTVQVKPEASVEALNKRIGGDVTQFIGPFAVNWTNCPQGGEQLDPDTDINAYAFNNGAYGPRDDGGKKIYHTVQITGVSRYRDAQGNVAAWCGTNVDEFPGHPEIQGTDEDVNPHAIIVIPAVPGCEIPDVKDGAMHALPCPGMPIEVYNGLLEDLPDTPGEVELLPPEPTTTTIVV